MEFLMDPSIWVGLLTLVVLEIVLGIDNLVFIAILADKLPPKQRDKARLIGLSLALIMRLALLSVISWMVTLTKPLFSVWDFTFSGRDLIMLVGGLFLLFKATTELHERLENRQHDGGHGKGYASFWVVVMQIVVLDAVFSLDAVITAVGMVNHLPVMMAAVVIAMAVMLLLAGCSSSNELSAAGQSVRFVEDKPGSECQLLGTAMGKQSNWLSGQHGEEGGSMRGAANALRNQAAEMGGNVIYGVSRKMHPYL
jgi:hypothetical protein